MENNRIPTHVSIIMDGNGRWAQARGKERIFGHLNGVDSVRAVTEACLDKGIKYLSIYAFSEENWGRPKEEVSYLMKLMSDAMSAELENFIRNGVRFRVLGDFGKLSHMLRDGIRSMEEATAAGDKLEFIVLFSYSGRWDILQAAKRMAKEHPDDIDSMTQEDFSHYLVTDGIPDPDLIIRTSGEQRISNYLLWQGAYSEFYFTNTLWPDFRREQFDEALAEYARRDRRFGKVK